ncbi:cell division protein ZapC domain-containing protein [uncultured Ferrimonas sp.]|uniref:cell division protein ZapC domain-containing protein n=1 Tax=uncultured Ferrimonas sp. TaxID=432640 RepID=UPI002608C6FD|nr:cell division protein ZapC domain-containing protein [uncultured Ferrimonas sp.]
MLLMPDQDWYWFFDETQQQLALALGPEWVFTCAIPAKQLNPDCHFQRPFTAEHAGYYVRCLELLPSQFHCSDAVLMQAALNMVAAKFFAIPMMPKSWFFNSSATIVYAKELKTISLQTSEQRSQFVIVDANDQWSLLMLIDAQCQLNPIKSLDQFALIKVMNDRLMPAIKQKSVAIVAA